jgi:hypothetical protein
MKPLHSLLALLLVWLLLPAAVAGPGSASLEESLRLKAQGFEPVRPHVFLILALPHNSIGSITNELMSQSVLRALTQGLSIEPSLLPAFDVVGFEDFQADLEIRAQEIWWRFPVATPAQLLEIRERLTRYVQHRQNGHTARYATESLLAPARSKTRPRLPLDSVLWANPDIPPGWLQNFTNQPIIVQVPAERLARPGIVARRGEIVDLKVTNYWFKVVDGPVTWTYISRGNGDSTTYEMRDSQEDDPAKAEIFRQTRAEVTAWMEARDIKGLGSCHSYWGEMRRILKEKHGIVWKSPSELEPFRIYD